MLDEAETNTAQANERADAAVLLTSQAEERASQAEVATQHAWTQYHAFVHSRSWRLTAHLRSTANAIKCLRAASIAWLTLKPGSRPRRVARRALQRLRNWVLLRLGVKHILLLMLQRLPRLNNRLKTFHYANPMETDYTTASLSGEAGVMRSEPSPPNDTL